MIMTYLLEFTGGLDYLGPEILIAGDYNIKLLDVHYKRCG